MRIAFVTTELSPFLPGGAGSVVHRLRDGLVERGDTVVVILIGEVEIDLPSWVYSAGSAPTFEKRASLAAGALSRIHEEEPLDLIEFQDFDGLAFATLAHRSELGLVDVPIQVRFHGPADLMFSAIGVEPPDIAIARTMEIESFHMADRIVAPSAAIATLVEQRYGIDPDRTAIGNPPLSPVPSMSLEPDVYPTMVSVARLGEVKGTHDLIQAAVPVLVAHPDARLILIGEDGWSATADRPMSQWLTEDLIPHDVADQIIFTGRLVGERLWEELARAWFVVIPSRFESFNLVAHEARSLGLPIVVANLPAFEGFFDARTGAEVYDGSLSGLTSALELLVTDTSTRRRLAAAPLPGYGDPYEVYGSRPAPRHPRSQAGLATIAVQRLERSQPPPPQEWSPQSETRSIHRRAASRTLGMLPHSLAEGIVDRIPQRLRDRLAFVADWRYERERALTEAHQAALEAEEDREQRNLDARIAAGNFPDLNDPAVSIIIPCHDDGVYLDDAIRSIFRQSMDSFEIIVVDDGSTDPETLEILDRLPWPRTTVIHQENRGLSSARNTGIAAARGRFFVPLDADDMIEKDFLAHLLTALEADPQAGFAACRARLFEDINAIWVPRPYNPYQLLLSNSIVGCVLMRSAAYKDAGGYDETMHNGNEDWDLWIRMFEKQWGVVEVPEVLFRYRKHGISMSVETEARFESGRAEIVERHRDLYELDELRTLKATWYPLVSVIVDSLADVDSVIDQDSVDAQIVTLFDPPGSLRNQATERGWSIAHADDLATAIDACTGKFVIRWKDIAGTSRSTISDLTAHLEGAPDLGGVATSSDTPLVLIRRWSLLDPSAPSGIHVLSNPACGSDAFSPGQFPDPLWMVPKDLEGLPVQRQRPEEEGRLPSWLID